MKNPLLLTLAYVVMMLSGFINAYEDTNTQIIEEIRYNGDSNHLYFVGAEKWVGGGCTGATYVEVKSSNTPGIKEIMSIGLAAKLAKVGVRFIGECNPKNPNYFIAHYIILR